MSDAIIDRLYSAQTRANPYPIYEELRGRSPVKIGEGERQHFGLFSFRHVYDALRDHETFAASGGIVLLGDDPPRHTQLRNIVNRAFTPRRVVEAEPWISAIVDELLEEMPPGEHDVVDGLTIPLPVKVIARMLDIPAEDYRKFKEWSDSFVFGGPGGGASQSEMFQYFGALAAKRRANPGNDLISAVVSAEVDGEVLNDMETVGFAVLLLVAGNETTTNLISNMLNVLAQRPETWAAARADRSLVEPIIEETLRYESPVQSVAPRRPRRDVEIDGVTIPAGSFVQVFVGAANRDPAEFPAPDEFRLDRKLGQHVAFGMGIHYCLGAPLARAEARIALNALLDRFATLEPGSVPGTRLDLSSFIYGFSKLPLALA